MQSRLEGLKAAEMSVIENEKAELRRADPCPVVLEACEIAKRVIRHDLKGRADHIERTIPNGDK